MSANEKTILLTVDLEDWFQVENFKKHIKYDQWQNKQLRFEKNTFRLLELFERHKIKATFFILGWCGDKAPHLIKKIQQAGHEVASHGYNHHLCHEISDKNFLDDIHRSKCLLEDITGFPIYGYRAPSFSVSPRIIKILKEEGYKYDSSYNSFGLNKRYGSLEFSSSWGKKGIAYYDSDGFYELPISNIAVGNKILPWGGGGYFRLYPFLVFRSGVTSLLKKNGEYLFYIHPWEIDKDQPRVSAANPYYKFRHYYGQGSCLTKLNAFISTFKHCSFKTCSEYLGDI